MSIATLLEMAADAMPDREAVVEQPLPQVRAVRPEQQEVGRRRPHRQRERSQGGEQRLPVAGDRLRPEPPLVLGDGQDGGRPECGRAHRP